MLERGFVLQPLAEYLPKIPSNNSVASNLLHPITSSSILSHLQALPPPTQHLYLPAGETSLTFDIYKRRPTLIMAILNLTPDSFSDGGVHSLGPADIVSTVRTMVEKGADIIDLGGQSTRPNASEITYQEEINRVVPAIKALRTAGLKVPISIDTYRASVARAAIGAGANIINDVSAGQLDADMFSVAATLKVPIVLMHMRGTPKTMTSLAKYDDVITDIGEELAVRVQAAVSKGIQRRNIILDPGLGFAKIGSQNLEIIRRFGELRDNEKLRGMPWVIGPSRKRFISGVTGETIARERVWGTAAAVTACVQGGADIVRVHDVGEMSKVVKMCDAIWRTGST